MRPLCRTSAALKLLQEVLADWPELRPVLAGVHVIIKTSPDDTDRARGAADHLRGYYWGEQEGGSCPDALERVPGADDDGPAEIVLFADNIRPLNKEHVARVFMHEVGHLCGFDEWEITEGLGLQ